MTPPGFVHQIVGRPQTISLSPAFTLLQDINAALGHGIILLVTGQFTLTGTILRCSSKSKIEWNISRNFSIGFATQRHRMHSHHSTRLKICFGNNSHVAKGILLLLKYEAFCKQPFSPPRNEQKSCITPSTLTFYELQKASSILLLCYI